VHVVFVCLYLRKGISGPGAGELGRVTGQEFKWQGWLGGGTCPDSACHVVMLVFNFIVMYHTLLYIKTI
jgi:hypothetical protein